MKTSASFLLFCYCVSAGFACLLDNGRSAVYLSVFEDLQPGEIVGRIPIQGSASGEKPDISLRVIKGDDVVTIPAGSKELRLKKALDRDEGSGKLEAVIECKSSLADSDFSQLNISVFVTVKDVNDNAPEFDAESYDVTIKEELPVGTIVFTDFEATDKDQPGPNSFVQYSIVPGPFSDLLEIVDPFKPVVTVKNRIDYEKLKSFEVLLEARDQGEPSRASTVPLRVTVEDVNDRSPYFSQKYYTCRKIKDGALVLRPEPLSAKDGDELGAKIKYVLEGDLSENFSIDDGGIIRIRTNPPPPRATFFVHAYEVENRDRNATAIVSLTLDSNIRFDHDVYSIKLSSETITGASLLRVRAYSTKTMQHDGGLRYALSPVDNVVSINSTTGDLIYHGTKEKRGTLNYNVTATDGEETASAKVTISLDLKRMESDAEFEQREYHMQMGSIPVLGAVKIQGERPVKYKLMTLNKDFAVDEFGVIRVQPGINPSCTICELVVLALDDEGQTLAIAKVTIKNPSFHLSSSSILTIVVLVLLALIFSLLLLYVCKKVHYAWRCERRANICWMNSPTDTGITITGTMPGGNQSRYIVNAIEKERGFEAVKSPAPKRAQGAHLVPVTVTNQDGAPTVYF